MKKLLVLFVVLAVASSAFAADFSFSWDTDWGWSSNFDDSYADGVDELELAVAADVDEYNAFAIQIEPGTDVTNDLFYDYFKITTDLGAYLGLSGVGVSWVNGYTDPGDEEYSDVLRVGLQNAGLALGLAKDWNTDVNLDFGAFWASVAANWNISGADESAAATEDYDKEMQFMVGAVDLVPGLSFEAGYEMEDLNAGAGVQAEENIMALDFAYVMPMDGIDLTVAGGYANYSEADYSVFGAGLGVDYMVDDATSVNASIEMNGDDTDAFANLGGGVGVAFGDLGVDADFLYNVAGGVEEMVGIDLSGYAKVGMVQFRVGYAVTDYGWANNANGTAGVPLEGGAYFVVTADF